LHHHWKQSHNSTPEPQSGRRHPTKADDFFPFESCKIALLKTPTSPEAKSAFSTALPFA
jgi:hypothetical protein